MLVQSFVISKSKLIRISLNLLLSYSDSLGHCNPLLQNLMSTWISSMNFQFMLLVLFSLFLNTSPILSSVVAMAVVVVEENLLSVSLSVYLPPSPPNTDFLRFC